VNGRVAPGAATDTNPDRTLSPYFFVENGDPAVDRLPLKETKADVHIAGVIAAVVVTRSTATRAAVPERAVRLPGLHGTPSMP
jgi:Ca-activated chloride channel family protein